jgi:hypothetical protein
MMACHLCLKLCLHACVTHYSTTAGVVTCLCEAVRTSTAFDCAFRCISAVACNTQEYTSSHDVVMQCFS